MARSYEPSILRRGGDFSEGIPSGELPVQVYPVRRFSITLPQCINVISHSPLIQMARSYEPSILRRGGDFSEGIPSGEFPVQVYPVRRFSITLPQCINVISHSPLIQMARSYEPSILRRGGDFSEGIPSGELPVQVYPVRRFSTTLPQCINGISRSPLMQMARSYEPSILRRGGDFSEGIPSGELPVQVYPVRRFSITLPQCINGISHSPLIQMARSYEPSILRRGGDFSGRNPFGRTPGTGLPRSAV